jgi:hypothetical protein
MSFTVGGSTPQLTFADATVQNTAALPLTGGSVSADITVNGLTVGRGAGAVSTNTAVGASALTGNTSGASNSSLGYQALYSNTTASYNTAVGYQAGYSNTTGTNNTFIGQVAGRQGNGTYNTFIGDTAGYNTSGTLNALIGQGAGYLITSGSKNTVLGSYSGNQGGLDIRTSSNNVVLSDGDGNPRIQIESSGNIQSLGGCYRSLTLYTGSGVTGTSPTLNLPLRAMGYIQVFGIGAATERMTMYAFTDCGPTSIPVAITQVQTSGFNLTFTITTVNNLGGFTVSWSGSNSANITVTATYIGISF